mmetsp:Transcript_124799/g.324189  ORF Transcript_124799/g.324189 Transcript_124799/m.324189 type:complete len:405 (+) Transcript_124799:81-1295(+)
MERSMARCIVLALGAYAVSAASSSGSPRVGEDSNATAAVLKAYQVVMGEGAALFEELGPVLTKFTTVVQASIASQYAAEATTQQDISMLLNTIQQMTGDLTAEKLARGTSVPVVQLRLKLGTRQEVVNPPECLMHLGGIVSALTSAQWYRVQGKVDCAAPRFDNSSCASDVANAIEDLATIVEHTAGAAFDCANYNMVCTQSVATVARYLADATTAGAYGYVDCDTRQHYYREASCNPTALRTVSSLDWSLRKASVVEVVCEGGEKQSSDDWGSYAAAVSAWSSSITGAHGENASRGGVDLTDTAARALGKISGAMSADASGGGATTSTRMTQFSAIADVVTDLSGALRDLDAKVHSISRDDSTPPSFVDHLRFYARRLPSALGISARSVAELFERSAETLPQD